MISVQARLYNSSLAGLFGITVTLGLMAGGTVEASTRGFLPTEHKGPLQKLWWLDGVHRSFRGLTINHQPSTIKFGDSMQTWWFLWMSMIGWVRSYLTYRKLWTFMGAPIHQPMRYRCPWWSHGWWCERWQLWSFDDCASIWVVSLVSLCFIHQNQVYTEEKKKWWFHSPKAPGVNWVLVVRFFSLVCLRMVYCIHTEKKWRVD